MSLMFLLNPPKKGSRKSKRRAAKQRKLSQLRYPRRIYAAAKKHPKPSKTFGRKGIQALLRDELKLKKGQRPIKHRLTFWRSPTGDPRKLVTRSPRAIYNNSRKKKRRGVKSNMAKRKRRSHKKAVSHRRKRAHSNPRRAHRKSRRKNPIANRKRSHRKHRRTGKIRAIVLANKGHRRRSVKRYRSNPLGFLSNPMKGIMGRLKGSMGPIGQAAGIYGGYVVTNLTVNSIWDGPYASKLPAFLVSNKKYMKPVTAAALAFGLSWAIRKWLPLKQKEAIAKAVLIGGLFGAVKSLVTGFAETINLADKAPGNYLKQHLVPSLNGYTDEPLNGFRGYAGYTDEPLNGYTDEPLADVAEEEPEEVDRYKPRY